MAIAAAVVGLTLVAASNASLRSQQRLLFAAGSGALGTSSPTSHPTTANPDVDCCFNDGTCVWSGCDLHQFRGCGAGRYQTGRATCPGCTTNKCSACADCPAGRHKGTGCTEATECVDDSFQCPEGTFHKRGATTDRVADNCDSCPAGTYQNATGFAECKPCAAGLYAASKGRSVACADTLSVTCPAGKSRKASGATGDTEEEACAICPFDTFTDQANTLTACTGVTFNCPAGKTKTKNQATGNDEAGACVQCLAGTYQDAIGNLLDEDTCRVCPVGYETRIAACSAGGTGLKVGLPCLSDADCDGAACDSAAASVEATACAPCRTGQSDADSTSSSACAECPKDTIQKLPGQDGECFRCPYPDRCINKAACVDGSMGSACETCIRTHYRLGDRCYVCDGTVVRLVVGSVVVASLYFFATSETMTGEKAAALKQAASFAQNVVLVALVRVPFPDGYRLSAALLNRLTNAFDWETIGPECLFYKATYYVHFLLSISTFVVICGVLLHMHRRLVRQDPKDKDEVYRRTRGKILRVFLLTVTIAMTTLTTLCCQTFLLTDNGHVFMQPEIEFGSSVGHAIAMGVAGIVLAAVALVPVGVYWKTAQLQRIGGYISNSVVRDKYGALFDSYTHSNIHFEALSLARRFVMVAAVSLLMTRPTVQLAIQLAVTFFYLVYLCVKRPFTPQESAFTVRGKTFRLRDGFNTLEISSTVLHFVNALYAFAVRSLDAEEDLLLRDFLTFVVVASNVAFFSLLLGRVLHAFVSRILSAFRCCCKCTRNVCGRMRRWCCGVDSGVRIVPIVVDVERTSLESEADKLEFRLASIAAGICGDGGGGGSGDGGAVVVAAAESNDIKRRLNEIYERLDALDAIADDSHAKRGVVEEVVEEKKDDGSGQSSDEASSSEDDDDEKRPDAEDTVDPTSFEAALQRRQRCADEKMDQDEAHDAAVWACPQCTYENVRASKKCSMCGGPRPKGKRGGRQKDRAWREKTAGRDVPMEEENITHERACELAEQSEREGDLQGALNRLLQAASRLPNPEASGGADLRTRLAAAKVSRDIARLDELLARKAAEAKERETEERRAMLLDEEIDESFFDMAPAEEEEEGEEQAQQQQEASGPAAAQDWACSVCTFLNVQARAQCEMCGTAKPSAAEEEGAAAEKMTLEDIKKSNDGEEGQVFQWVRKFQ